MLEKSHEKEVVLNWAEFNENSKYSLSIIECQEILKQTNKQNFASLWVEYYYYPILQTWKLRHRIFNLSKITQFKSEPEFKYQQSGYQLIFVKPYNAASQISGGLWDNILSILPFRQAGTK